MENYEPLKILGEGSFGKVYLMKHKAKRRLVCVKVIKIKNVPKKERQACCLEVNLLQRLNHPNIVGYEESFLSPKQDSLFIVMQYCDGGDLASRIKSAAGQLFPERKVLNWFVQMALGLHYMHSNRILHRDLKTQNIFLLGNGRLVLGDLGISKVLEGTSDMAETLIGTPYYMSPEIFQNKPYNHKSDIWALGCVLYEMVTLNHAFDASSINGLAAKIMRGRYPPVDARFSSGIKDLIGEMLSLDPERRPDLEDILRKTLIKRHIGEFFEDIMTRPSSSLGEGTIAVRAGFLQAAQGGAGGKLDPETESLKKQLEDLSLQSVISRALNPPTEPTSAKGAIRLARDQTNALKREEERKQIVEETLAKLRAEREDRLRKRTAADPKPAPQLGRPSSAAGGGQGNNRGGAGAGLRPSQPVAARASEQPVQRRSVERRPSAEAITDPRLIAQRKAVEAEEKRRQQLAQQQQARREEAAAPAPERPRPIEPRVSSRAEERLASPPASAPQQLRQNRAAEEGRKREDERLLQERGNEGVASRSPRLPLDDVQVQRSAPTPARSQAGAAPSRVSKSSADEGATGAGGDETPRDRPANRRPSPAHGAGQQGWAGAEVEDGSGPPSSAVPKPSSNRAAAPASAEPRKTPTADDAPQAKGGGHGRRSGSEGAGVRSPGGQQPDRGSKPHATNEEDDEEDVFEMLVKEGDNDDEGDADDDLREREVELQRELDVATQRMEHIRRTIDTTRHLLPPSVNKGRGSKEVELEFDEKEDDEEDEEEQLARRAGAKVVADTINDDAGADDGGSARRGYKGVAPSSGARGAPQQPAPGKRASPSVAPSKRDGLRPAQQGFAKPAAPQPTAESKRGGNVAPSDPPPRSGKLEDRIRESRSLLNRLLGEEVFKRCYVLAREVQDEGEDLDSYEARLRSSMAPLLREKIKYADLIMQLVFMEDSHR